MEATNRRQLPNVPKKPVRQSSSSRDNREPTPDYDSTGDKGTYINLHFLAPFYWNAVVFNFVQSAKKSEQSYWFPSCIVLIKDSYYKNEFMKSSFLPKYQQKNVRISAMCSEGRNSDNFSFVFWEKQWLHKFILKLSDL